MRIYTLWTRDGDVTPWLINAVDQDTVLDTGFPESYIKMREEKGVKELIIFIPLREITSLFNTPSVVGKVETAK